MKGKLGRERERRSRRTEVVWMGGSWRDEEGGREGRKEGRSWRFGELDFLEVRGGRSKPVVKAGAFLRRKAGFVHMREP